MNFYEIINWGDVLYDHHHSHLHLATLPAREPAGRPRAQMQWSEERVAEIVREVVGGECNANAK